MTAFLQLPLQLTGFATPATAAPSRGVQWEAGEQAGGAQDSTQIRSNNAHLVSEEIENIILSPGATRTKAGVRLGGIKTAGTWSWRGLCHYSCPRGQEPRVEEQAGSPKQGPLFNR